MRSLRFVQKIVGVDSLGGAAPKKILFDSGFCGGVGRGGAGQHAGLGEGKFLCPGSHTLELR